MSNAVLYGGLLYLFHTTPSAATSDKFFPVGSPLLPLARSRHHLASPAPSSMLCSAKSVMHASARLPRAPVLRRPATARPAAAARAAGAAQPSVLRVTAGYQRPLTNQERKAKRAEAQRLGRALVTVQVGQKGG